MKPIKILPIFLCTQTCIQVNLPDDILTGDKVRAAHVFSDHDDEEVFHHPAVCRHVLQPSLQQAVDGHLARICRFV